MDEAGFNTLLTHRSMRWLRVIRRRSWVGNRMKLPGVCSWGQPLTRIHLQEAAAFSKLIWRAKPSRMSFPLVPRAPAHSHWATSTAMAIWTCLWEGELLLADTLKRRLHDYIDLTAKRSNSIAPIARS